MTAIDAQLAGQRDQILAGLDVRIPRPTLSMPYRIGLFLVALVMIVLPLIYVALVGAACYGLYLHVTEGLAIFEGSGGTRGKLFLYITPLIVGSVLVFFMVKPLLAPRRFSDNRLEVDRDAEPFLYEFVETLCMAVGAPAPRRILVDCQANASAGFHQGGLGLTNSGRELTIGLPLAGSMSVRQLAGILAHEFGHFSQGAAMRLSFIVMRVNAWFGRVVFERDDWDQRLVGWSQSNVGYISLPSYVARGCVWLTRRVLHGLMWIGHVVSSNMSRQMEYDADSFEIHLAGSEAFAASMTEIIEIGAAHSAAIGDLQESWRERRLAADLPDLVVQRFASIPDEVRDRIRASLKEETTSLFASHPRALDRIAAARQADESGAFTIEAPATVLFDHFDAVCRDASMLYYEGALGSDFESKSLVANQDFVGDRERSAAESAAAVRFLQGGAQAMVPLVVPALDESSDVAAELAGLRDAVVAGRVEQRQLLAEYIEAHDGLSQAALARIWLGMGLTIDPAGFGLEAPTEDAVQQREQVLRSRLPDLEARLREILDASGRRIARLAALDEELLRYVAVLAATNEAVPHLVRMRGWMMILSELFEHEPTEKQKPALQEAIEDNADVISSELASVRAAVEASPYPFEHAEGQVTVGRVAVPTLPKSGDVEGLWPAAMQADDVLTRLHYRLLGRISVLAEAVEGRLGLPPLPEPPRES